MRLARRSLICSGFLLTLSLMWQAHRAGRIEPRAGRGQDMPLKVELRPGERIIIGESLITNDSQRTRLFIEGDAPILREKDIMTVDTATTVCRRVYLAVQVMYLTRRVDRVQDDYIKLIAEVMQAAPSTAPYFARINTHVLSGEFYKALKEAKKLIEYETQLMAQVTGG
jgi:flagellar protein FlbT